MNDARILVEISDELCDANKMLEVCRGYTQAEEPDMEALNAVLFKLTMTYEKILQKVYNRNQSEFSGR